MIPYHRARGWTRAAIIAVPGLTGAGLTTWWINQKSEPLLPGEGFADDPDPQALAMRLADGRRRDLAAGRTLTGPHRADLGAVWGAQDMPAALASTGEQKALLLSLVLANARALEGQDVLLLLDEAAAHLDAARRDALHARICRLPAQALLTGTGRELFAGLEGQAAMVEVARTDGASHAVLS